jgi:predicted amidophosphoribosyltransferase
MAERRKSCRQCGKPATATRTISKRGNCPECGAKAQKKAIRASARGDYLNDPEVHQRWVEGMRRAAERASSDLVDAEAS